MRNLNSITEDNQIHALEHIFSDGSNVSLAVVTLYFLSKIHDRINITIAQETRFFLNGGC